MSQSSWADALDLLEKNLKEQRQSIKYGTRAPLAFIPPTNLGPIPTSLAAKAQELLDLTRQIESEIVFSQAKLANLLLAPPPQNRNNPVYLDQLI